MPILWMTIQQQFRIPPNTLPSDCQRPRSPSERCSHTGALRSSLTAALCPLPAQRVSGADLRRGAGTITGRRRILRNSHSAGAGQQVLRVPFGKGQDYSRRVAARHGRTNVGRRRIGSGSCTQQTRRKLARLGIALSVERDATQRQAARCRHQRLREMDLNRCARSADGSDADGRKEPKAQREGRSARSLVIQMSAAHCAAKRCAHSRCTLRCRSVHTCTFGSERAFAITPSSPAGIVSPTILRPHRPAADGRRARRFRR